MNLFHLVWSSEVEVLCSPGHHSSCHHQSHHRSHQTLTESTISRGGSQPSSLVTWLESLRIISSSVDHISCLFEFSFISGSMIQFLRSTDPSRSPGWPRLLCPGVGAQLVSELVSLSAECHTDCLSHQADQPSATGGDKRQIMLHNYGITLGLWPLLAITHTSVRRT